MQRTIYHDFHIAIEADDSGDGYIARILRSTEGRAEAPFVPPGHFEEQNDLSRRQEKEERGKALFESLFASEIGTLFRQSLSRLQGASEGSADEQRILRVRVAIDPRNPHLAPLFESLELETLFDDRESTFLTLTGKATLIRDLETAQPLEQKISDPVLRLLLVTPKPAGSKPLDSERERELIEKAWKDARQLEIERLENPTFRELQRRLRRGSPVHILHFIGHGEVCDAANEGYLEFEDQDGKSEEIYAGRLASLLNGYRPIRLAVLAACHSGRGPGKFPARGVAAALIGAGVPAVVAMRRTVPDDSAAEFSYELYDALADGRPVDEAMTFARRAIENMDLKFEHWATPALFMSSTDGRLLDKRPADAPIRLGIRTRMHPFSTLDDCDHLLDLVPLFDGRKVEHSKSWTEKIEPNLEHFLRQHVTARRPVQLRIDAHLSVAFAAGRVVDTRGVEITIRQATLHGFQDWHPDPGSPWDGPLWSESVRRRPWRGDDWAVCLGVTADISTPVWEYVKKNVKSVGRLLSLTPAPKASNSAIRGAEHAFALAQEVKRILDARTKKQRRGVVHLFLATPGVLAFYLGQLSRGWGEIQLYEWEFENRGSRTYQPSLRIVPKPGGRR